MLLATNKQLLLVPQLVVVVGRVEERTLVAGVRSVLVELLSFPRYLVFASRVPNSHLRTINQRQTLLVGQKCLRRLAQVDFGASLTNEKVISARRGVHRHLLLLLLFLLLVLEGMMMVMMMMILRYHNLLLLAVVQNVLAERLVLAEAGTWNLIVLLLLMVLDTLRLLAEMVHLLLALCLSQQMLPAEAAVSLRVGNLLLIHLVSI